MMIRGMDIAPIIEEDEMGLLMEEGTVVVGALQVHIRGKEVALIMGMEPHQILDLSGGTVLIMEELQALQMIHIKGISYLLT